MCEIVSYILDYKTRKWVYRLPVVVSPYITTLYDNLKFFRLPLPPSTASTFSG